jgi:RNA polymerase sigma-70 factor, ECF subfamily
MAGMASDAARPEDSGTADLVTEAYVAHAAGLQRFLRSLTRDDALAEDLVQEAFLRLTAQVASGRPPAAVGPWLWTVGRNLVTSSARRAAVANRSAWRLVDRETAEGPDDAVMRGERDAEVRRAMARLPRAHRAAVLMAAEGYRGPEVAGRLGRTPLATRALLCRARGRLRVDLARLGEERVAG